MHDSSKVLDMEERATKLTRMAAPTQAKKRLGTFLRELRTSADVSAKDAAAELKSTDSTVHRYESGHVLPVWGTVRVLLSVYRADNDAQVKASRLWDNANDEAPPVRLPKGAPKAFRRLVNAERDAAGVKVIELIAVPGLLQVEAYARAMNLVAGRYANPDLADVADAKVNSYVSLRLDRQRRLEGPTPLSVHAVIDEAVVRRVVGGSAVMREQLEHLVAMTKRPHVTLQVVPFGAGAHGSMSGPCTVVTYHDPEDAPGVYLEYPAGGAWVENANDVSRFTTMFDDIAARAALTVDQTVDLIEQQIRALE